MHLFLTFTIEINVIPKETVALCRWGSGKECFFLVFGLKKLTGGGSGGYKSKQMFGFIQRKCFES